MTSGLRVGSTVYVFVGGAVVYASSGTPVAVTVSNVTDAYLEVYDPTGAQIATGEYVSWPWAHLDHIVVVTS